MKVIIIFLSILFFSLSTSPPPECFDGLGHIKGQVDSIHHFGTCIKYVDTVEIAERVYEEYFVISNDCDSIWYRCARCDSSVVEVGTEKRFLIRTFEL